MTTPQQAEPVGTTPAGTGQVGNNAYNQGVAGNGKRSKDLRDSADSHDYHYNNEPYHAEEHDSIHGYSIKAQLEGWHANRGNKSVARSIIPPWCPPKDEPTILNPFKLVKDLTLMNWLMFLCGWFAWICDGQVQLATRL